MRLTFIICHSLITDAVNTVITITPFSPRLMAETARPRYDILRLLTPLRQARIRRQPPPPAAHFSLSSPPPDLFMPPPFHGALRH